LVRFFLAIDGSSTLGSEDLLRISFSHESLGWPWSVMSVERRPSAPPFASHAAHTTAIRAQGLSACAHSRPGHAAPRKLPWLRLLWPSCLWP